MSLQCIHCGDDGTLNLGTGEILCDKHWPHTDTERTGRWPNLDELRCRKIPTATCERLSLMFQPDPEAKRIVPVIDEYLACFAWPDEPSTCLRCGAKLGGLFGMFRWGIASGEGFCDICKYPARGHHRIPEVGSMTCILQYHPDVAEGLPEELET